MGQKQHWDRLGIARPQRDRAGTSGRQPEPPRVKQQLRRSSLAEGERILHVEQQPMVKMNRML